ncbi:sigma 54-interacting transcriptional regulator [Helicovermis profundi]|uniref:Sigma 54-interacting transcriptional regulator n=1 Tax=Helicovermis profundi TaxID=3065157 RepID=A0AAU9EDU5_9FIRM|nr:sigma 54-interacting transcriptional regulator [Clostridia bacterium S502]
MKKLLVLAKNMNIAKNYKKQLDNYFGDNYFFESELVSEIENLNYFDADVILVSSLDIYNAIRNKVDIDSDILIINRTITKNTFDIINNLNTNKEVYVLDDNDKDDELISILERVGIRHLILKPYLLLKNNNYFNGYILIFGDEKIKASNAVNVKCDSTLLDIDTILDVGYKLGLDNKLKQMSLQREYVEFVTKEFGLSNIISVVNDYESQLKTILNIIKLGIININCEGKISYVNDDVSKLIDLNDDDIIGYNIKSVIPEIDILKHMELQNDISDKLIRINDIDIVLSMKLLFHLSKFYGAIIILRKYSELEKQQYLLRKQMIGKGHVAKYKFRDIIGGSIDIVNSIEIAKRMSKSVSSVLIFGESGTGKELFAHSIHDYSDRKNKQFVAINCGAFPETLLESELFGYEEGAFTGARRGGKVGLIELADGGTLFLDEIEEMPYNLQIRLLRVLQEKEIMKIGGDTLINVNIRIISATNKDLFKMMKENLFRKDLYYRLNVLPLKISPLRNRKEDIFPLIDYFKKEFKIIIDFSEEAKKALYDYNYLGNVRELRNFIEYFKNMSIKKVEKSDIPFECEDEAEIKAPFKEYGYFDELSIEEYILSLLYEAYKAHRGIGRKYISDKLKENNIFVGESRVRDILLELRHNEIVEIKSGRAGTVITEKGIKHILEVKSKKMIV